MVPFQLRAGFKMIYKPLLQVSQLAFAEFPNSFSLRVSRFSAETGGISGAQFR
jgi:hypothetical protein